jgi:hypothetical protein
VILLELLTRGVLALGWLVVLLVAAAMLTLIAVAVVDVVWSVLVGDDIR